ncbi:Ribonuclease H-like superfamily [Sesbania bispinosa]|nr:Ribonuclease H-like superfamily [Sesbania bispinosa]
MARQKQFVFSQTTTSSSDIIRKVAYFMESYFHVMSSLDWISPKRSYSNILVGWEFPPHQWIKCNVDASYQDEGNLVGCGGCYRDHTGKWLSGFTRRLGRCSINMAELWAIYTAIILGRNANITKLWIETDSNLAVTLITNGCSDRQ